MDFIDSIKAHAKRVMELKDHAVTEEATKMALIVPFLRVVGYDPNDPRVVVPEFCADFGEKKACKVDYAIKRGNEIVMIVEAKKVGDNLDAARESQLQQYFQSLISVKIAILTDGVKYKFYTDLEHKNVMDKRPFMTFDFAAIDEALVPELKKLCNECFDLDTALSAAQELKYIGQLKKIIAAELENPSEDFVKLLARQVYDGMLYAKVVEGFRDRIKSAFDYHINDVLNARLQSAMQPTGTYVPPVESDAAGAGEKTSAEVVTREDRIATTQVEVDGFNIIKAILREVVAPSRIAMRDTISYCGVLLDDKNTKPICRMHFNNESNMQLEIFEPEQAFQAGSRKGVRHRIETLDDIFAHAPALKAIATAYNSGKE